MTTTNIDATRQKVVDDFNADHLPGTWVRYWTGTRQDPAKYGQTRSKAELLSGHTPVVWVTGHGACIALTHVDVIPGQPDGIEDDSRGLPSPVRAAGRLRDYISANGDGIYDLIDGYPLYARDLESLRRAGEQVGNLVTELAEVRAKLTAANRRNDGLQADLDSATKANTAWATENAELRKQVCLIVTCQGCGEAYEYDGGTVHFSNPDQAQSMVEDDEWRRIGNEFVCGGCIYEPHPFTPAVNDETTCARCDIEADEHEPVKAEAVAR